MSRTTSGPRVTIENGVHAASRTSRQARVSRNSLGGLVRIGRGAERDLVPLPTTRELAPEHLGDVRLDPDRAPVAFVRRPVGALLEVPDVTERAAMRAAHVGVERPAERHAFTWVSADLHGSIRYSTRIGRV